MRELAGRVVAVTGAGSGIGRALAEELGRRGCELALADVDAAALSAAAGEVGESGAVVTHQVVDVADREAMEAWAGKVSSDHGRVNVVVNNAGVALGASVEAMAYADLDWLMAVDFDGVVNGTKAFLPRLKESGEGHVVNISSVFGLVGIPWQSAYSSAKFAVRGFTEALRIELDMQGCGVSATAVHPGGIRTNIVRNARMDESALPAGRSSDEVRSSFEALFLTSPARAARSIVRAVERDKRRVLIGPDAHLFNLLAKLPPAVYQKAIARAASREL
jgi:short-subunit dehydrogenase